jgi:hypothetical protein
MNYTSPHHEVQTLLERHLERIALRLCESGSLEQCLQNYRIASTIQVVDPKGKQVTLQAKDIVNVGTWKKFLKSQGRERKVMLLSTEGLELIEQYQEWLLHHYTDRYRRIATKAQRTWLEQVVTLVVVRHIMEYKYQQYLVGDQQAFADAGTVASLDRIYYRHRLPKEVARCVNHIIKEPEQRKLLMEEFYIALDTHLKNLPPLVWEPLPPLPGDIPHPYLLLSNEWEDADE